ncbi:MAG: hypothetical protein U9Q76_05320 [candidate division WOR-3 bacterium]|nr:hypothetical protein [candidate division WOR-3 bacterium]
MAEKRDYYEVVCSFLPAAKRSQKCVEQILLSVHGVGLALQTSGSRRRVVVFGVTRGG